VPTLPQRIVKSTFTIISKITSNVYQFLLWKGRELGRCDRDRLPGEAQDNLLLLSPTWEHSPRRALVRDSRLPAKNKPPASCIELYYFFLYVYGPGV
jgi:hypothetical protein